MRHGFSLVELSIVLVILGLLVGGILAGQSLIRASELRAVSAEYARHAAAIHAFRDKYFALPGDFDKATSFWGTAANCPGTNAQPSADATTCDGNSNGKLDSAIVADKGNEYFRFWQHLANAGLVEGQYSGVTGPGSLTGHSVAGFNTPLSKFSGGCWSAIHWNPLSGHGIAFDTSGGGRLFIGKDSTSLSCSHPLFTPEKAWNVDTKSDDGMPATGHVVAYYWDDCTDAASSAAVTANYALNESGAVCSLNFKGFY